MTEKSNSSIKQIGGILLLSVALALVVIGGGYMTATSGNFFPENDVHEKMTHASKLMQQVPEYEVLRRWQPQDRELSGAEVSIENSIGVEILISEGDTKERLVKNVIKDIANEYSFAVVKVYNNRSAWQEEKTGDYSSVYDRGYLASYFKWQPADISELTWFQEIGPLEKLFGTKNQL